MEDEIQKLEKQIEGAKALGCVEAVRYLNEKLDVMKAEMSVVIESMCLECHWQGLKKHYLFLDGHESCPCCKSPDFLTEGEELGELLELEGECPF